jgi:hypothetical protein
MHGAICLTNAVTMRLTWLAYTSRASHFTYATAGHRAQSERPFACLAYNVCAASSFSSCRTTWLREPSSSTWHLDLCTRCRLQMSPVVQRGSKNCWRYVFCVGASVVLHGRSLHMVDDILHIGVTNYVWYCIDAGVPCMRYKCLLLHAGI